MSKYATRGQSAGASTAKQADHDREEGLIRQMLGALKQIVMPPERDGGTQVVDERATTSEPPVANQAHFIDYLDHLTDKGNELARTFEASLARLDAAKPEPPTSETPTAWKAYQNSLSQYEEALNTMTLEYTAEITELQNHRDNLLEKAELSPYISAATPAVMEQVAKLDASLGSLGDGPGHQALHGRQQAITTHRHMAQQQADELSRNDVHRPTVSGADIEERDARIGALDIVKELLMNGIENQIEDSVRSFDWEAIDSTIENMAQPPASGGEQDAPDKGEPANQEAIMAQEENEKFAERLKETVEIVTALEDPLDAVEKLEKQVNKLQDILKEGKIDMDQEKVAQQAPNL